MSQLPPRLSPPYRPVSPLLKLLMLGPLALGAGYTFLILTLLPGRTGDFFAWRMSPATAGLLGAAYGGSCAMLTLALRAREWVNVRVAVAAASLFMMLMLGATLLGRGTLHLTSGTLPAVLAAWGWLAVHVSSPFLGMAALGAQWRTRGTFPRRPPRLPWWVAAPMAGNGAVLTAAGLALYAAPGPAARHWPWRVGELDVRVIGAWGLVFGAALLLSRREAELRRVRGGMAALVCTGLLGLAGLLRHADRIAWGSPGAWLVVLALLTFTGLGLCGAGLSWLFDPPGLRAGRAAPVARPARAG
ncbi:hypothetical protein [Kitasatospora sp. NPDC050543]|uniref:hypothetical protein n=1 Tax=Kitasatospora sp. NPDC050543 TaxID=3364054 RepID=UPI0037AB0EE9